MSWIVDRTGANLEKSLDLLMKRQEMLTANIANMDTPHYTPIDLTFEGALREAEDESQAISPRFVRTDDMHLSSVMDRPEKFDGVSLRPDITNTLDGNSVDMEAELARTADNGVKYQTTVEMAKRRYSILTAVIGTFGQG
jgi:flagellar basal-body rod protein FlgB